MPITMISSTLLLLLFSIIILSIVFYFILYFLSSPHLLPNPFATKISPESKYILITGAANGIGLHTTRKLLKMGSCVIASDVDVKGLQDKKRFHEKARLPLVLNLNAATSNDKQETSSKQSTIIQTFKQQLKELRQKGQDRGILIPVRMDVSDLEDIKRARECIMNLLDEDVMGEGSPPVRVHRKSASNKTASATTLETSKSGTRTSSPPLFAIVNNAGVALNCGFEQVGLVEMQDEELLKVTGINFFGVVRVTQQFFPLLNRMEALMTKGAVTPCIVNIASVASYLSPPFFSYYCATKHAVRSYSDSLRAEMHSHNCRVACIEPGFTGTDILKLPNISSTSEWTNEMNQIQKNSTELLSDVQEVDAVGDAIVRALFSNPCPAHQLVETQLLTKLVYLLAIYVLPSKVIDWAVMANVARQLRRQGKTVVS